MYNHYNHYIHTYVYIMYISLYQYPMLVWCFKETPKHTPAHLKSIQVRPGSIKPSSKGWRSPTWSLWIPSRNLTRFHPSSFFALRVRSMYLLFVVFLRLLCSISLHTIPSSRKAPVIWYFTSSLSFVQEANWGLNNPGIIVSNVSIL